jgi:uncharacterized SAM-binding protein YcdF (DUF218 family)
VPANGGTIAGCWLILLRSRWWDITASAVGNRVHSMKAALARALLTRRQEVILRVEKREFRPALATFFFQKRGRFSGAGIPLRRHPPRLHRTDRPKSASNFPETLGPDTADAREPAAAGVAAPVTLQRARAPILGAVAAIVAAGAGHHAWLPNSYTQPLLGTLSLLALAALVWRKPRLGWAALMGFVLISWPPVEWLLSRPLEAPYPVGPVQIPAGIQGIVVLSSAVEEPVPERPFPLPDHETFARCEFAAWMQRRRPELPVLASGGGGHTPPLSASMQEQLRRAGVPEALIWTEDRSHNTYQSAVYSAEILRRQGVHRIALGVDARSMWRAAACFRRQSIDVSPVPWKFREWHGAAELLPGWRAILGNERTLHEMAGILWYRLRGWI